MIILFLFETCGHVIANLDNLFEGIIRQGGLGWECHMNFGKVKRIIFIHPKFWAFQLEFQLNYWSNS